jgi:hypothetical protein
VRADRRKRRRRNFDAEVEFPERAGVHERAVPAGARQETSHGVQRFLSRGEPDPLERNADQRFEALEGEREVASPLIPDERVDLVDDDRPDGAKQTPSAFAREHQVQGLGCRDQDVGRPPEHRGALARRRVSGPNQNANLGKRLVQRADLGQRSIEVLAHVVGEGSQRRDVEDLRGVGELRALPDQGIDGRQKRGERLSRSRRSRDEDIAALPDCGPALALRSRGLTEAGLEPATDDGMEGGQSHRGDPNSVASRRMQHARVKPA